MTVGSDQCWPPTPQEIYPWSLNRTSNQTLPSIHRRIWISYWPWCPRWWPDKWDGSSSGRPPRASCRLWRGSLVVLGAPVGEVGKRLESLFTSFLKGQGHQGLFFLVKWGKCTFLLECIKGTKAIAREHWGNRLHCPNEVSCLGLRHSIYNIKWLTTREKWLRKLPTKNTCA